MAKADAAPLEIRRDQPHSLASSDKEKKLDHPVMPNEHRCDLSLLDDDVLMTLCRTLSLACLLAASHKLASRSIPM